MRSSGIFILFRSLLLLAVCSNLLIAGGCATLPKADQIIQESSGLENPPTIVAAHRELSARESKALIKRLNGRTLPADILERHIAVEEAISGRPLIAGNKVTLLVDGPATYAAMSELIQNATDHINFETFTYEADETGRSFASILLQKAAEGVRVNLLYDAVGSLTTPSAFFRHLRHGGIQVVEFNPINPFAAVGRWLQAFTHRDHRKILIGDGAVAITGGVNITSVYSGSISEAYHREKGTLPWRDTDVQIEGPAAAEFQRLFMDSWGRQNGPELAKRNYFPPLKQAGDHLVRVIGSGPGQSSGDTYVMYVAAISFAVNTIHLTNSYFIPDEQMLKALTNAAERGVDVKLILPAKSDSEMAFYAGRSHYSRLLESGVKLYEHRNSMLHAKTAVIDGVWSSVGSTNMDLWSFLRNDEVNAVILGRDFADQMEAMFRRDIENSDVVHLEKWEQRSFHERMREWFSILFGYWL